MRHRINILSFLLLLAFPVLAEIDTSAVGKDSIQTEVLSQDVMALSEQVELPEQNAWPESPQARGIRQVMMPSPALATGACEFSIPIYTIEVEDFSMPVSLQYRSNGIKPEDDPQPIGYGWILSPPMRVSRRIMGRPDEYFTFVGDRGGDFVKECYENGYGCLTMEGATSRLLYTDRYDTEHDIYTIYLIDKTLTLIYKDGKLHGVDCNEYAVECDKFLSYIKVTDPKGNIYNFGTEGECIDYLNMRTEWLLTSITLQSGSTISVDWQLSNHGHHGFKTLGATTLYYNTGTLAFSHVNNAGNTAYKKAHDYYNTKNLACINFPGGKLECAYGGSVNMLKSVTVSNSSRKVFTATLSHSKDPKLLSEVALQETEKYSFDYDPTTFSRGDMVDWWGFYNGRDNSLRLSPQIRMTNNVYNGYVIGEANREIDSEKMRAYMLTKATYPTGGSVEWEYETHRFLEQTSPVWVGVHITNEHSLSEGGGLRVKKMTLRENDSDSNPRIKTYIYGQGGNGLARVTSAPMLHTFLTETPYFCLKYCKGLIYPVFDQFLSINTASDYMTGHSGGIPIWYDRVTEIDSEGKTEYDFDKICPTNIVDRDWGCVYPVLMYDIFSNGPVQTSITSYKSTTGGYAAIERTVFSYGLSENKTVPYLDCFTPVRKCLLLYPTSYAPDFGPNTQMIIGLMGWQYEAGEYPPEPFDDSRLINRDDIEWYEGQDYTVFLTSERLTGKKTTRYFDNYNSTVRERYEYLPGTGLLSLKVVSNGFDSIQTEYTYTDTRSPDIASLMRERNVLGVVTGVKETFRSMTTGFSHEMGMFGSTFRPKRIWLRRGDTEWNKGTYTYDTKGHLTKFTSVSGNTTEWTRDSYGNPLSMSVASGSLVSKAEWEHLVGVKSMTSPARTKESFAYDNAGRLAEISVNGDVRTKYTYSIGQTSSVTTSSFISSATYRDDIAVYDGLGRNHISLSQQPDGKFAASLTEYDVMGRQSRSWSPVSISSRKTNAKTLRDAAVGYHGDDGAYSLMTYEPSQRGLPVSVSKCGSAWHDSGKVTRIGHHTNYLPDTYSCPQYWVTEGGVEAQIIHAPGTLTVEETIDEDGDAVEIYKDIRGLTVGRIENRQLTSFVYDDAGNLRYILPPGVSGTRAHGESIMRQLAYCYEYDSRGRMVTGKIPGVKAARYMYDPADRLVAEHSAHHPDGVWRLYGYDNADRQVVAVDCTATDAQVTAFAASCRTASLSASGEYAGYTLPGAPAGAGVVWARYYDSHDFISANSLSSNFKWMDPPYPPAYRERGDSFGLLTGVYTGQGFEAYYYDVYGNLIQHCATGFNTGRHNMYYGYFGQPVATESVYPGTNWPTVFTRHSYDDAGRLSATTVMLGSELPANKWRATVSRTYNAIGQLAGLRLGNATRSFTYDANGWLKSSLTKAGTEQRSETLFYADGTTPCYNGNISAKVTSAGRYDYAYDKSNRLTSAKFSGGSGNADFSASYSYDNRGNVTSLTRKGIIDKAIDREMFGLLDDLTFSYTGNQISLVDASSEALPFYGMTGVGLDQNGMRIRYDASGRICSDETRGITLIEYDNDGHPVRTVFDSGNEQIDSWDGFGNHLSTEFFSAEAATPYLTRRYYGDGHIQTTSPLDGNSSLVTGFDGGYFDSEGVHYFITDYQGNNIAVVDSVNGFTEEYGYYPYGEPWRESEGNPFTFSGNERLRLDGINEYDFHARRYVASLPAFSSWDPLNGNYPWLSPYAYCAGNPIRFTDPTGLDWVHRRVNGIDEYYYDREIKSLSDINKVYGANSDISYIKNGSTLRLGNFDYTFNNDLEENKYGTVMKNGLLQDNSEIIYGDNYTIFGTSNNSCDAKTLHKNYFGTSYTGPYNPKTYGDDWSYQYKPRNPSEIASMKHDQLYDKAKAEGLTGALIDCRLDVIKADAGLVYDNFKNIFVTNSTADRLRSLATGTSFAIIVAYKFFIISQQFN
ncbi:MAG: DUF6443 domain-containing protein [Bacteroides sp.]|nr:DUF6443 domain-containing protein [Bacteroides sp.]